MNPKHLKLICTVLDIGSPIGLTESVPGCRGGSFMWRVNTDTGSYAIKQLAPDIDMTSEKLVAKYELSESIAYQFQQQGIPAISALEKSGRHLIIIDNVGYLVYPWVDGYTLSRNEVSENHALKIAETIAKLHKINMNVHDIGEPRVDIHTNDSILKAINQAEISKCNFVKILNDNQNLILSMYDNYLEIIPQLLEDTVVSHGDLDQLNVIWDKDEKPVLIDWESVRKLNPTREIVRASLNWSGVGTDKQSLTIYTHMLKTYQNTSGILNINHMNAALNSVVGSAVNWILFNINISCTSNNINEMDTANQEVINCILSLLKFQKLIPDLMNISKQVLSSVHSDKANE